MPVCIRANDLPFYMEAHTDMPLPFALDELYGEFVDAKPQSADWSEGWCETWDYIEAEKIYLDYTDFNALELKCEWCGELVGVFAGRLHHMVHIEVYDGDNDECDDIKLELEPNQRLLEIRDTDVIMGAAGSGSIEAFEQEIQLGGPMMNFRYPIRLDRVGGQVDAAFVLIDLPLVVITDPEGGEDFIALSGGGMDLSWEICEAYMRLGYLPPTHFNPERMCKEDSELNRAIVAAYQKSCEVQISWLERRAKQAGEAIG